MLALCPRLSQMLDEEIISRIFFCQFNIFMFSKSVKLEVITFKFFEARKVRNWCISFFVIFSNFNMFYHFIRLAYYRVQCIQYSVCSQSSKLFNWYTGLYCLLRAVVLRGFWCVSWYLELSCLFYLTTCLSSAATQPVVTRAVYSQLYSPLLYTSRMCRRS